MLFLVGIANFSYSQTTSPGDSQLNLPPGFYLNPDQPIFDLSYKLEGELRHKEIPAAKLSVLKALTAEELLSAPADYQQYVREGKAFIESLSENVRSIYTEAELWYIFAFDLELSNQLLLTQ